MVLIAGLTPFSLWLGCFQFRLTFECNKYYYIFEKFYSTVLFFFWNESISIILI